MWILSFYHNEGIWLFVGLNSFIHTIMYAYYAASVYHKIPFRWSITLMQMIQFLTGFYFEWKYVAMPCHVGPLVAGCIFTYAYVGTVFLLFVHFFTTTYILGGGKDKKKEE